MKRKFYRIWSAQITYPERIEYEYPWMKFGDARAAAGNPERVNVCFSCPRSIPSGLLKPLAEYYSYSIPSGF